MHILIAPDSFKGSLEATEFTSIVGSYLRKEYPHFYVREIPLADGGEGSLDVIIDALKYERIDIQVNDPLNREVKTFYLYDKAGRTAFVEMAKASGLVLMKNSFDIMNSSTLGTGELILDALKRGAEKIVLFIGGSATNDAGIGLAHALGYRFLDARGEVLDPVGKNLIHIDSIDDKLVVQEASSASFFVATDVDNCFYGPDGAAYVYGPQKGARQEEMSHLDRGLKNISRVFLEQYNMDVSGEPGAGAAGGIGGGMLALFSSRIISGSSYILELLKVEEELKKCQLLITGEGRIDSQTLNDKLIFRLASVAKEYNKCVIAICGYFDGDENLLEKLGIDRCYPLANNREEIPEAIRNAPKAMKALLPSIAIPYRPGNCD